MKPLDGNWRVTEKYGLGMLFKDDENSFSTISGCWSATSLSS